jgi:hypothetical protein
MLMAVDFAHVSQNHQAIDARLANWARWSSNRSGGSASPMFRLYRSAEVWGNESASAPVDGIDAQRIQKAVGYLPTPHRRALSWCYIKRNNPRKAAASLGETMEGLARLIEDARQMLIDRRA